MNVFRICYLIAAIAACTVSAARAAVTFDFSWVDQDNNVGTGRLEADLVSGQCYVVSGGTVHFTSGSLWLNGDWTVVPLSNPPQQENRYGLDYANLLWLGPSQPRVGMLMFERYFGPDYSIHWGESGDCGEEIVISAEGFSAIQGKLLKHTSEGVWYGANAATIFQGSATVQVTSTPVPEPSTYVAGALLLFPFAGMGIRRLKRA